LLLSLPPLPAFDPAWSRMRVGLKFPFFFLFPLGVEGIAEATFCSRPLLLGKMSLPFFLPFHLGIEARDRSRLTSTFLLFSLLQGNFPFFEACLVTPNETLTCFFSPSPMKMWQVSPLFFFLALHTMDCRNEFRSSPHGFARRFVLLFLSFRESWQFSFFFRPSLSSLLRESPLFFFFLCCRLTGRTFTDQSLLPFSPLSSRLHVRSSFLSLPQVSIEATSRPSFFLFLSGSRKFRPSLFRGDFPFFSPPKNWCVSLCRRIRGPFLLRDRGRRRFFAALSFPLLEHSFFLFFLARVAVCVRSFFPLFFAAEEVRLFFPFLFAARQGTVRTHDQQPDADPFFSCGLDDAIEGGNIPSSMKAFLPPPTGKEETW